MARDEQNLSIFSFAVYEYEHHHRARVYECIAERTVRIASCVSREELAPSEEAPP